MLRKFLLATSERSTIAQRATRMNTRRNLVVIGMEMKEKGVVIPFLAGTHGRSTLDASTLIMDLLLNGCCTTPISIPAKSVICSGFNEDVLTT
jgi:hypothetical protein